MASLRKHNNSTRHQSRELIESSVRFSGMRTGGHVKGVSVACSAQAVDSDHYYRLELNHNEAVNMAVSCARYLTMQWEGAIMDKRTRAQMLRDLAAYVDELDATGEK